MSDSSSVVHLVLPAASPKGGLSELELSKVGGGRAAYTHYGCCSDDSTTMPFECSFQK